MFHRILLPVDLQETRMSERAAEVAVDQARKHGAKVHLVSVLPGYGMPLVSTYFPQSALKKARESLEKRLDEWAAKHIPSELLGSTRVDEGTPYRQILEEIRRVDADLVVIASHDDPHVERVLLGSCASKVVEHSHVSVMVIRESGERTGRS
jgi:nucleotide-binding universal stress UspA family protein